MRGAIRWAIGAMLLLAGCGSSDGQVYAVPLATAQSELVDAGVPLMIFGDRPGLVVGKAQIGQGVVWQVQEGGKPILQYTAALQPVDDGHTSVNLTVIGLTDEMKTRLATKNAFSDLYRTAMEEKIGAILQHRVYLARNLSGLAAVPGLAQKLEAFKSQVEEGGSCPAFDKKSCERERAIRLIVE